MAVTLLIIIALPLLALSPQNATAQELEEIEVFGPHPGLVDPTGQFVIQNVPASIGRVRSFNQVARQGDPRFNEAVVDLALNADGSISNGTSSVVRPADLNLGSPCGVPISSGLVGLHGGFLGENLFCADQFGRFAFVNINDEAPSLTYTVLPRFNLVTAEGTMDATFPERSVMGKGGGASWVAMPAVNLFFVDVIVVCELTDQGENCIRAIEPPNREPVLIPMSIWGGDPVLEFGVNSSFASSAEKIIRTSITDAQEAPLVIVESSDIPQNATEAIGPITDGVFGAGGGLIRARESQTNLEHYIFRDASGGLTQLAVAGGPAAGTEGDTYSDFPNAFARVHGEDETFAADIRLTQAARRGAFAFGSFGTNAPAHTRPVILPGDLLPGGTVREASVAEVAGDMIFVRVDYELGGGDIYVVLVPEPGPLGLGLAALVTVAILACCRPRHSAARV